MFRDLLRKKQQLSIEECINILQSEKRGVLCVNGDEGYPYGMPMNHWYDQKENKIYFHCGKKGHRIDSLCKNNKASFCTYDSGCRQTGEWALTVKSVVVFGRVDIISDYDKIVSVSENLCRKFTDDKQYIKNEIQLYAKDTYLLVLTPEHMCGKLVKES